jgi:probable F420-dependent oxidoreductase
MSWPESVTGKLGEQMEVMRAFWRNWAHGENLNIQGDYYKINLSSPFFTPAAHSYPEIPIFIAGVNTGLAYLAGVASQGFHTHPFHTREYLQEVIIPKISEGAAKVGRSRSDVEVVAHAFVVTNPDEREFVRQQIAFYASTPSYRSVLEYHGWEKIGFALTELVKEARWGDLPDLISDEIADAFATVAPAAELGDALKERYAGIAERINLYLPFVPGERTAFWQILCDSFQS